MQKQTTVTKALTISTSAYTAGDVVGGLITFNVANAAGSGIISSVRIVDDDNEKAELTLYLFRSSPTAIADADTFAPSVADLKAMIGKIVFYAADYTTLNNNATVIKRGTTDDINFEFTTTSGNIFGYLVCTGTPTYTAVTDLSIVLSAWLDG